MRPTSTCALAAMFLISAGCDSVPQVTGFAPEDPPMAAGVTPTVVACGATITTDFKLGNDLVCPGDALFVNADDITVNLNGHSVTGLGAGVGITVRMRHHVEIKGGYVAGFVTGMFISQSHHVTIKENRLTQNREAIFLIGTSNSVVKENVAWANQLRGVMLRPTTGGIPSTGNLVSENVLTDNPSGILVFGQSSNTLKENWISGSTFAALDLTGTTGGTGNLIKENRLEWSAAGVRFGPGWNGNSFVENRIAHNTCGTFGTSTGNTFKENRFIANGSDAC